MAAAASASRLLPLLRSVLSSDKTNSASKDSEGLVAIAGEPFLVTQGAKATIRTELVNDPGFTPVAYIHNSNHNLVSSHIIDPLASCPGTVFRLTRSRASLNHGQQQLPGHGLALVNALRRLVARIFRTADFHI